MASSLHGYTVRDAELGLHKAAYKPAPDLVPSTSPSSRAYGPAGGCGLAGPLVSAVGQWAWPQVEVASVSRVSHPA